jgi:predicted aspartyl protease
MTGFARVILVLTTLCSSILLGEGAEPAAASGGTLRDFFTSHGFGGAPLQRRLGNHLFVTAFINGQHTGLLIDTGAPVTLIDKESVRTPGLTVTNTNVTAGGAFGRRWEHYGVAKVNSVTMGNCTIANVPVALANESDLNYYTRLPHLDGLFGAREMVKFGMVIDCARQEIYISPTGPNSGISQQLAALMQSRGFTRVPLRRNANSHFDVPAAINAHTTRLIVDTGAITTNLAKKFAVDCGVVPGTFGMQRVVANSGEMRGLISNGIIKELKIGEFTIANAEVMLAPLDSALLQVKVAGEANAGLFGIDYLSLNFAVIDLGGMALYLRHAD